MVYAEEMLRDVSRRGTSGDAGGSRMTNDDKWWIGLASLAIWIWLIERRCGRRGTSVVIGGASTVTNTPNVIPSPTSGDCGCA